ncbi:MAG TPA: YebC/PmpR family DNA-binding transcriptional regulator [Aggregatilineales bacterium]|nr:YebC/PmpR family DNA-binding transcriptional regulator [Aggregatilineales bacterium]
MSGHSKWSTIKRKKGALDAKRGKIFTRLGREITIAAREGGGNPESNTRLRLAIDKAKASNMPKDNIERAIARGAGGGDDGVVMETITYEGYAPHGVAILIDVLTDNKNRSLSSIRQVFNRANGNMAEAGSVMWQFDRKGYVEVQAEGVNADDLFMVAADAGADDVIPGEETIEVYTPHDHLGHVENQLVHSHYKVSDSYLTWIPKNEVDLDTEDAVQVMGLIEKLEELDDVQGVASTLHITDEVAEAFAAV